MHWTVAGADAIIALRCCKLSGRFEDFWERRSTARAAGGCPHLTILTCAPIALQFLSVNLRPGLHESPQRLGNTAAKAFDRVHSKDRRVVLVTRVENGRDDGVDPPQRTSE